MTSIADPLLRGLTGAAVVVLVAVDFLLTRRPHEVTHARGRRLVGLLRGPAARLRRLDLEPLRLRAAASST